MEQGNIIQVFRYRTSPEGSRIIVDIWEISSTWSINVLANTVSDAYTDGSDNTYEVHTIIDGVCVNTRKLCWDVPTGCRKERLCVECPNTIQDFRVCCLAFLT